MTDDTYPDFLHIGAQKAGSTWIHYALNEHPEVFMPDNDNVSYFDVYYHHGEDWYRSEFEAYDGEDAVGEESPGYLKHPLAPERAAALLPDANIVVCIRNPIERAYSHWWHAQKNWTNTPFENSLNFHATNDVFITPGFYDHHLSRWEEHFTDEQIKIVFFDDFRSDNESFIQDVYDFLGVDATYTPSVVGERIKAGKDFNEPGFLYRSRQRTRDAISDLSPNILRDNVLRPVYKRTAGPMYDAYQTLIAPIGRSGYEEGMDPETRRELEVLYHDSIRDLEDRTGRDLDHWFTHIE